MFRNIIFWILVILVLNTAQSQELNAREIITNVLKNKKNNYLKKHCKTYEYLSYSKFKFTADATKISNKIDTIYKSIDKKLIIALDSSNYKFKKEVEKHHYYLSEKIAKHQFANSKEKEIILVARMAGFKQPIYEFLALGIQNISFYENKFSLLGTDYVSPLAKDTFKNYHFTLLDSEFENKYLLQYKSINRKKSVGLEGVLYIDKKSFAITKGIAKLKGKIHVEATKIYSFLENENTWIPKSSSIIIRKGSSKNSIKAFRKLIGYKSSTISDKSINPEEVSYISIQSNNFDFKINNNISKFKNKYAVEISESTIDRNSPIWQELGIVSTKKEIRTYKFLDSLVKVKKVEKKLRTLRTFLTGHFPTKVLDIDLSNVINFNNHEGFRLGFGGTTNTNLSKYFKLSGYVAYGHKDDKIKHSYGIDFRLNNITNTWIGGSYTDDIFEAGKTKLLFEESNFSLINPRNINISQFYKYRVSEIHLHHDISPKLISKLQFDTGVYQTTFDYAFISRTRLLNVYNLTNLTLAFKWSPFSKFMKTPQGKFTTQKKFPIINTEITKSFNNLLDGDFNFFKATSKIKYMLKTIKNGSTELLLKMGFIYGEVPLSHLYNVKPNHSLVEPWRARINLSGTNAFETMLFNEFLSDKFVSFQIRQNFEKFRIGKKFKPKLSFITRFAFGDIANPEAHRNVNFKRMNQGYFESGLVFNQLFKGLGFNTFYRFGKYQFPKFEDNIAVKITYVIDLF